jgi:TonB-dependent receptor
MNFSPLSRRFPLLLCAAACVLPSVGAAQPVKPLDEINVTAKALDDIEQDRIESPVPEVGMAREDLKKQPALRLGDSLKFMPGVYFGGNPNENKDLQLRGLPKDYSRVQFGGVQIPDGGEAREFQLNRLPAGLFRKVKAIRNPSAEFESDGIGGRLELETVPIPDKAAGDFHLGYGARDSENPLWNASGLAGVRVNEWFGILGAGDYGLNPSLKHKDTDDFASDGSLAKSSKREEHKDVETFGAFIDAGFFYEAGEFHLKPLFLRLNSDKRSRKATTDFTKALNKNESFDDDHELQRQETAGFTASSTHRWSAAARQETLLGYYQATDRMPFSSTNTFKESGNVLKYDGREVERNAKEDLTADFQTKTILDLNTPLKQQVKFGAAFRAKERNSDTRYEAADSSGVVTDLTTDADDYHLTEDYAAVFVQDQIRLTDTLSILPGIRGEHVKLRSHDGGGNDAERSMTDWNPTLNTLYQPIEDLAFHLSFSRTINRPQFDQLSPYRNINDDDEEVTIGNPELDPAKSWNVDLGVDWKRGPLFLGANVFYKKISDVIQQDRIGTAIVGGDPYDLYQTQNVGDGHLKGVELDQRFTFSATNLDSLHGLQFWANESIYSSRVKYDSGLSSSFEEQPQFIANMGIDYEIERTGTRISLSGNFVDNMDWKESDGTRLSYAAEWVVNLSVRQRIAAGFEAFVEIINLTDEERLERENSTDNEKRNEFISSGRTVLAGVNYRF